MLNTALIVFCSFLSLPAPPEGQSIAIAAAIATPDSTGRNNNTHHSDTVDTASLITFARTLKGTPYRYACADPQKGFDCSGFVMYVFNHFQMNVPRSSSGFTNFGNEVDMKHSLPGDIILFTGTNSAIRKVGHVGIITNVSDDGVTFIHASSGKMYSVVETVMNPHYKERFLKVIRVQP
jgi:cell wall-associated NlpC family hydrolase